MLNALTFDIEEYFQVENFSNVIPRSEWEKIDSRLFIGLEIILSILQENNTKATFFVLGWVAERHKDLIRKIHDAGHEIASHEYGHNLVYNQTKVEFEEDLKKSITILENIIGEKVIGYRAPSFSITEKSLWALDILQKNGIQYDASIFPIKHHRYGINNSLRAPYEIRPAQDGKKELIEFPSSTLRILGRNFPFAGGGYLRLWSYGLIKQGVKTLNRADIPSIVYMHPWEFDVSQPWQQNIKFIYKFRHYINLNSTQHKLKSLLSDFNFASVRKVLRKNKFLENS